MSRTFWKDLFATKSLSGSSVSPNCYEILQYAQQESKNGCSLLTRKIASIGTFGAYPGNCERDLFRALDLPLEPRFSILKYICSLSFVSKPLAIDSMSLRAISHETKELYMVEMPCKDLNDPARKKTTTTRVPMILPHELLNYLQVSWLLTFV